MAILRYTLCLTVLRFLTATPLLAQNLELSVPPSSAHVALYFPQLAEGGPQSQRWETSFVFSNSYNATVSGGLLLFSNDGLLLPMDFGSGPVSAVSFSVPPFGTTTLQSRTSSPAVNTGWAIARSNLPIQGIATYRLVENGVSRSEITVPATLPTIQYFSAANAFLGIAVANTNFETISVQITARDNSGSTATGELTIPPAGHVALNLREAIPSLAPNFIGTVTLESDNKEFVALTLKSDDGVVFTSLPSGAVANPISQISRIENVFARVHAVAGSADPSLKSVDLEIDETSFAVQAFGGSSV